MLVLVTGAAGFIGSFTAHQLLDRGDQVVAFDNMNDYYDPALKRARLARLESRKGFSFSHLELCDTIGVKKLFASYKFDRVIHLAAQAGVRHSMEHPLVYAQSNLVGMTNILEGCRHSEVPHMVYASTSSVYGFNTTQPFSPHHTADHPMTFYAATKRANELMAHSYSHIFRLPTTGLRFFSVYGPWGRPDMALFMFTKSILAGQPIRVFNHGKHTRDFTYVDDIARGVIAAADRIATPNPKFDPANSDPASSSAPWRLYNIGCSKPVQLLRYIEVLEHCLGRKAIMEMLPLQLGDVPDACADTTDLARDMNYQPSTPIETGVAKFVEWYRDYYKV
ncbi:MAG: NAD-dependent epimerase [Planctomycetes bacterium]|nr:NAD-dependent epimerase [Planctomycetota bacterium]